MSGSPWLCPSLWDGKSRRYIREPLIHIADLHVLSDAVPDFLPEKLRVFLPDHKQNLLKTRLQGVVDGIINNQVSPAIHRIHLL